MPAWSLSSFLSGEQVLFTLLAGCTARIDLTFALLCYAAAFASKWCSTMLSGDWNISMLKTVAQLHYYIQKQKFIFDLRSSPHWTRESPVLLKITEKMPLLLGQPSEPDCQNINILNMSWRLKVWWLGIREKRKERNLETSGRPTLPGQGKFPTKVRWIIFVLLAHVNL